MITHTASGNTNSTVCTKSVFMEMLMSSQKLMGFSLCRFPCPPRFAMLPRPPVALYAIHLFIVNARAPSVNVVFGRAGLNPAGGYGIMLLRRENVYPIGKEG